MVSRLREMGSRMMVRRRNDLEVIGGLSELRHEVMI